MSIFAFYFRLTDGSYRWFKHEGRSNISYSMSEPISVQEVEFHKIHLKRLFSICRIFTGYMIVSDFETYCMISHGKYISIYNIE
jgi:hypothetical protein